MRRPEFLLIDEPELNLHPRLQADFLTSVAAFTTHGVLFATHSVGLARTIGDRIYSVQKQDSGAQLRPFEQSLGFAEFLGEMSFSSFKELGHDAILLVEGVTEVKTVQQWLRLFKKDHKIVILPLGGSQLIRGGVEQELNELSRICQKVHVLIDSERTTQGGAVAKDLEAFIADCQKLGFATHITELRALENYFNERAIQVALGSTFKSLAPFQGLKQGSVPWAKSANWRIARAMTKDELLQTDVGHFLAAM